ncbi:hypothetical protein IF1G_10643 [Cordyceps javanica]|uniref:DNA mismatch repair protein HSM3 N-terminal domain-containing protein n=1 Tax=Cordyceps javanica TaxID=43265 RepID=A0A545UMK4_9HYPO|nr:hypothetical protein IF1G_10643 [Cordyceps javanica]
MDAVPISRLDELHAHLEELGREPDTPIDARLLDEIELQLTESNIPPLLPTVLVPLTRILRTTTAPDPEPLLSLTTRLLAPLALGRVLALADAPSVAAALRSPLPGANRLALAIRCKAARAPADAALLSTLPELVAALVARWLDAPDVGVGERAGLVLGDVLETDCDVVVAALPDDRAGDPHPPAGTNGADGTELVVRQHRHRRRRVPGHGRVWNLIFGSEQIFATIPHLCGSPASPPSSSSSFFSESGGAVPTARQVSLAQGRLLRLLPRLATLNMSAVSRTAFPHLVPLPQTVARAAGHGLLQWAALAMVDKSDVLMHLSLIDFFETHVSIMRITDGAADLTRSLVRAATANDEQLKASLRELPDRTVEEEAEPLRVYIQQLLN